MRHDFFQSSDRDFFNLLYREWERNGRFRARIRYSTMDFGAMEGRINCRWNDSVAADIGARCKRRYNVVTTTTIARVEPVMDV